MRGLAIRLLILLPKCSRLQVFLLCAFWGVLLEFRGLFVPAAEEEGKGAALFLPPGRLFVLFSDSRFVISMHSVGKWEGFAKMAVGVYSLVGVLLHSSD